MYVIIYLIIYTRAVSVSSVVCGGGVLGVVVVSSVWCGGVLGGVSVSSVWCVVSFLVCGGGVVCGVLPGVWWWCGGGVLGGIYPAEHQGGHTTRLLSAAGVSLLNQGFWVEFTDAIALIINYLGVPFGCAFAEWYVG